MTYLLDANVISYFFHARAESERADALDELRCRRHLLEAVLDRQGQAGEHPDRQQADVEQPRVRLHSTEQQRAQGSPPWGV